VTLAGTALIGGALNGDVVAGTGIAGDTALFQGVAVPIAAGESQVAGVLMAAWAVDSALTKAIERETSSEVVFYLLDTARVPRITATTLSPDPAFDAFVRQYHDRLASATPVGDAIADPDALRAEAVLAGRHWIAQGEALLSAGGDTLGGVVTLSSREAELATFTRLRDQIALAGALGLLLAFGLSYVVARRISRPILALATAARRAAAGNITVALDGNATGGEDGEIGDLADAVRSMLVGVQEREVIAEYLRLPGRATPPRPRAGLTSAVKGPFTPGSTIGDRYEITDVLGVGGAGVVYKAHDRELQDVVAVKALRPEVLDGGGDALDRLRSEIRLARRISHRNVVRTHDIGDVGGTHFITMEYVAGVPLDDLLAGGTRLPVPVTLSIGRQLALALDVAHEQGVIHRDIKPQNLVLRSDGVLKVMDFGVARLAQRTSGLTLTGQVVGTPAYMAPEQLLGDDVDHRADIYATGVVLYECLAGRRPFEAESITALIAKMLSAEPPALETVDPTLPHALVTIVMTTLSRDRDRRPRTAAELHQALARLSTPAPRSAQLVAE
jgi:serine/threonine-protein kinase